MRSDEAAASGRDAPVTIDVVATHDEIKAAGVSDVGDWGEKDMSGAYLVGTTLTINGEEIGLDHLRDF